MKNLLFIVMAITILTGTTGFSNAEDPSTWNKKQIDKWFEKGEWLNSWSAKPDVSINRKEFAILYFKNKERWDKAFTFLKTTDLAKLEVKRHDIDGNNLYALVSEYTTKNIEDARFEAHQKYVDIQYVISGTEQMSLTPRSSLKEVTVPYNAANDIEYMTVTQNSDHVATPANFFLFFPSDIHRPSVKVGENSHVKKVVLKVKID